MMTVNKSLQSQTPAEKYLFNWKIVNYADVRWSNEALNMQQFLFGMGETIGLPTKWKCNLACQYVPGSNPNCKWLLLTVALNGDYTGDASSIYISVALKNGMLSNKTPDSIHDMLSRKNRSGYTMRLIPQQDNIHSLPKIDADGSLTLDIEVTLFHLKATSVPDLTLTLPSLTAQFETKFRQKLQSDFLNASRNSGTTASPSSNLVKLVSKDDKEFLVDREMLMARSPVFLLMFQPPTPESQEGLVRINDISGKTLEALLMYMEAGRLSPNWNDSDIFEEFLNAANKYLLKDLQDFLSHAMGPMATLQNCVQLLIIAKKHRMNKAEKDLLPICQGYWKNAGWVQMKELFKDLDADSITMMEELLLKRTN